jgi:hypothetical protein
MNQCRANERYSNYKFQWPMFGKREQASALARLAQSVERTTLNRVVEGSIPSPGASFLLFEETATATY